MWYNKKNNKLKRSIQVQWLHSNYKVPIVNLFLQKLSDKEQKQLLMGLGFSFVDKNKHLEEAFKEIIGC